MVDQGDPQKGADDSAPELTETPVATGRRPDGHYEPDAEAIVVARFTRKPSSALPPQQKSAASESERPRPGPPVEDVAVAEDQNSVWDARPTRT